MNHQHILSFQVNGFRIFFFFFPTAVMRDDTIKKWQALPNRAIVSLTDYFDISPLRSLMRPEPRALCYLTQSAP